MVQKMLGVCEAKNGTKANKLLHAGTDGHSKKLGKMVNKNPNTRGRESPCQKRQKTGESRDEKKIITSKEYRRLLNNFEMEGLMTQKGLWKLAKEKRMKERGELPNEESDGLKEKNYA